MSQSNALLSLLASMALTGANVPLGKLITAEIPIGAFLVIRFAVASLLLWALLAVELAAMPAMPPDRDRSGATLSSLSPGQWGAVLVLGLVGSVLFTLFLLEGVTRTSGADAGIITATLPALVAVLGVARGDRPGAAGIVMIALASAGVAAITLGAPTLGTTTLASSLVGDLLVGIAVLCEATFVLVSRPISGVLSPVRLSLAVSLVSFACCLPLAAPALAQAQWARIGPATWALALWYTATSSIICTVLWYRGVAKVATWQAGLATAAVPVAALGVSALLLGEAISPFQLAGAGLVIVAIVIGALSRA